ncbi:MAG: 4Fe-4S binding protein [bacterium]|nr:4Fe-4S binding protein [bacterium]MDW8163354.1 4Fe-4S binding protein [Candidatus Omnitrophota bacterium]
MKKPKIRELKEAIISLVSKPYTTKFPNQPHKPFPRFRGKPQYNEDECVGCGGCFQVCPSNAIDMIDNLEDKKRILIHNPDKCIFCGECERNCITKKGIKLTEQFDISYLKEPEEVTHKVEHNLILCIFCGEVIGTEKHIRHIYKKLGNLAFSQPNLITEAIKNLNIKTEYEEKAIPPITRQDTLKVICAKCRRISFIEDEKKKTKR